MISDKLGPHPWKLVHFGSRPFPPEKLSAKGLKGEHGTDESNLGCFESAKDLQIAW